ncbi:MAG TPA: M57 family metalloprotease [Nitrososphaeraceae archaeon]|nr:M57 family metalloprotease [Nitrososphaeraceae archaeon]
MKLYIVPIMFLFALLMAMVVFDTDLAFAKKGDSKSKKIIELCCTWGDSLDDGVLTFAIKNGGSDLAKIVKIAINDWEKLLDGAVKFKYVKDESEADIEIKFKKGKGAKVGKAVTYFDYDGFINFVEISISKKSYGVTLDTRTLEHVAKHEFGHALGLGHAKFKNTLMSANVDEVITKVSACELESVKYANQWKFLDKDDSPRPLDEEGFKCKKD